MPLSGCLHWGEAKGRGKEGLKGIDFKNIFRKILALWTWIILSVSLQGVGEDRDLIMTDGHRNVLRLEKGILGECLRQLPNNPNYLENYLISHQE